MTDQTRISAGRIANTNDLQAIKSAAQQNSPDALKAAAKQFEALMMNQIMKTMREATPKDDMFSNEQSRLYTSLLDQELSQSMAKRGGVGFADMIVRQMERQGQAVPASSVSSVEANTNTNTNASIGLYKEMANVNASAKEQAAQLLQRQMPAKQKTPALTDDPNAIYTVKESSETARKQKGSAPGHVKAFQEKMMSHANIASNTTGIPAKFMVAQAALETGWGKKQIIGADGKQSHNLFGIKATGGWKGKTVSVPTTEYVNGKATRKVEKFRAYDSYADSFKDYANLISTNPRYKNVMNSKDASSFAQGLQRAGYATDPNYANKLTRIIHSGNTV